ncbi:matrixin family metalloprotease [bacterium]|nr:matrixin family metalloprotease [bacterium]
MLRQKWQFLFAVVLVLSGCGQWRATALRWPARINSMQGFDSSESSAVHTVITSLNSQIGLSILNISGGTGSDINIRFVTSFDSEVAAASHVDYAYIKMPGRGIAGTRIAGRATLTAENCLIELGDFIFNDDELMQAVLWHEIGHCGGLQHVKEDGEIMSPVTKPFNQYSSDKVQRFFGDLLASIGEKK